MVTLRLPAGWVTQPMGEGAMITVPGFAFVPDIVLEVHPLYRRLDLDPARVLRSRVPPGAALETGAVTTRVTETGWPCELVEATTVGETRLLCCYRFVVYAGAVLVRASDPQRFAAVRADILAVLATARPRFRDGTPAGIAELWS